MKDKQTALTAAYDMLYLVKCALNCTIPNRENITSDFKNIYIMAKSHSVLSLVSYALDNIIDRESQVYKVFSDERNKSIRKTVMFDIERKELEQYLDSISCSYMDLKGIIIKDLYPEVGMRQMADNDIWFDKKYQKDVYNWFIDRGYVSELYDASNHDVYLKEPIFNFEMHTSLFGDSHYKGWKEYYIDLLEKVNSDYYLDSNNSSYSKRFTDNDFYVYIIAHEFKHYSGGGTGLRSLADNYILNTKLKDKLDLDYIYKQLKILNIYDFEKQISTLSNKVFSNDEVSLTDEEKYILETILLSGTYGTTKTMVHNSLKKLSKNNKITLFTKIKYVLSRMFPSPKIVLSSYKGKPKIFLPFYYIHRIFKKGVVNKRGIRELIEVKNTSKSGNDID